MRIVMMGTGPFAVPTLRALRASQHEILAVVTRPTPPMKGKRRPPRNPMREAAEELGLPVLDPASINADEARAALVELCPDLFVVCDYGQILKGATLDIAPRGGINLHGSLLPKYRGAAPVAWAIYHGETESGDTVIQMTPGLDAGPMLGQVRLPISADDTAESLEARLSEIGAPLVVEVVDAIAAGTTSPSEQDTSQATKAPRLKKEDGQIDWSRSAVEIERQVRAFHPWPRTFCWLQRKEKEPLRLVITKAEALADETDAPPGSLVEAADRLTIATGCGLLALFELQPAGKRQLSALEFLRGYPLRPGDVFMSSDR